jgi:hypothetical protein
LMLFSKHNRTASVVDCACCQLLVPLAMTVLALLGSGALHNNGCLHKKSGGCTKSRDKI